MKAALLGGAIGAGAGALSKTKGAKVAKNSTVTNSVQDNIAKNDADKLKYKNDPGAYFGTN